MSNVIEREVHVRAPIERGWQVVTDPAYVARWFGDRARIDLRPGGESGFVEDVHREGNEQGWDTEPVELVALLRP